MAVKLVKTALAFPWYQGPDPYCSIYFGERMTYFGRLQERSAWLARMPREEALAILPTLSPLDPLDKSGHADITPELVGTEFQFATCQEMFLSLVGMARERIVERAINPDDWNADYLLWSDDDQIWDAGAFLALYKNQVDICGALAFTARTPLMPVIYAFTKRYDEEKQHEVTDIQPIQNYKRDALQQVDAIGSGVMLTKADVFRKMGKPWFSSYGLGEDIYFCHRAGANGIPVYVDTRVKTYHRAAMPTWHSEEVYEAQQKAAGQPLPVVA